MFGLSAAQIVIGTLLGVGIMLGVQRLATRWNRRYEK